MKDVIQNDFNGLLVDEVSSDALANGISSCIKHIRDFDSKKIRRFTVERFGLRVEAIAYSELYKSILGA